jgi:hydrogenase expression/formation protein HypC
MCLAIPGKILSIDESPEKVFRVGEVSFGGITKKVNLNLVPEATTGDYVLVHVGVAISIVDEEEARQTYRFLEGTGELDELIPDRENPD